MRAFLIALLLCSVPHICPLLADVGVTPQAPKTAPRKTAPRPATDPDEGSVSDNTYTNRFFALEYTFPDNLDVQDQSSFMEGQLDQSGRTLVLLAAYGDTPDNQRREGVVLVADAATAQYGPIATGADYLHKVTAPLMEKQGYEFTASAAPVDLAGAKFYRADFHKDGESYQSQFVTLRRGYALVFALTGPTPESITRLTASLQTLKLGPLPAAPARPRTTK
jgi:hypothetical protein